MFSARFTVAATQLRMTQTALRPKEGWNVLHLFYRIDYTAWRLLSDKDQLNAKTAMSSLVQEVRAANNAQLLAFSVVSPKRLLSPRAAA